MPLSAANDEVRAGDQQKTARPEVVVDSGHVDCVHRGEVVPDSEIWVEFQHGASVFVRSRIGAVQVRVGLGVITIASHDVEVATVVHGRALASLPDARSIVVGVRLCAKYIIRRDGCGGNLVGIVAKDPALPRILVTIGCKRDIDRIVCQRESGALELLAAHERLAAEGSR